MTITRFGSLIFGLVLAPAAFAGSIEKAQLFYEHGLSEQAKAEFIEVITDSASVEEKAFAYYMLGSIAFDERRISSALDTWNSLVAQYPNSSYALSVVDRLQELSQIVGEASAKSVDNVVAQSYLRHAEFWSEGKDRAFTLDTSWISNVDAAISWYDKVIAEFAGTAAAQRAFEGKMRTLLGWKEPGQYGDSHGVRADFRRYMPVLITTFNEYITAFPEASAGQAFRYQISQAYWRQKEWSNTRDWLNMIITEDGGSQGFYADLAQRRLQKIEY